MDTEDTLVDADEMPGKYGSLDAYEEEDNNCDEVQEGGVSFYVNKGGFPINESTWERMWMHVSKIHPEGISLASSIRRNNNLPEISVPQPPLNFPIHTSIPDRLEMIQKYMNDLQYNHTGTQFYEIKKSRPLSGLMDTAKEMVRESLPIKCLEALIMGIYLTNGMTGVDRFSISFKSSFAGNIHRHVVLGVCYNCRYGALGMSRRQDLMYKPVKFTSLSKVILDFKNAYEKYFHEVQKIKVGLPIPHDPHSYEQITWKAIAINVKKTSKDDLTKTIDKHAREIRTQMHNGKPSTAPAEVNNSSQISSCNTSFSQSHKHHQKRKSNKNSAPTQERLDGIEKSVETMQEHSSANYQVRI